jgi:hypothetical protein
VKFDAVPSVTTLGWWLEIRSHRAGALYVTATIGGTVVTQLQMTAAWKTRVR